MTKKLPKSPDSHKNDKRARINLENVFPENWKLIPARDFYSGNEYGEDWICQIVDESDRVNGARFYIQSKVVTKKIGSRRVGVRMKVATLNYLNNLTLPVLLHYYHLPTETGYWMWFAEYYQQNYCSQWEIPKNKQVNVYIPGSQVLSNEVVPEIVNYVMRFQRAHLLLEQTRIATKQHPHFGFNFQSLGGEIRVGVYPKHDKALDANPIIITLNTARLNANFLNEALELGTAIEIDGSISIQGLPVWITEMDVTEAVEGKIKLIPSVRELESHLQFEYFDHDGISLYKSRLVTMTLVQEGSRFTKFIGRSSKEPIVFVITFNSIEPHSSLSIEFDSAHRSISAFAWYLDLLNRLESAHIAKVFNLDTNEEHTLINYSTFKKNSSISDAVERYIRKVALLLSAVSADLEFPNESIVITERDEALIDILLDAVKTGKTYELSSIPQEILAKGGKPVLFADFGREQSLDLIERVQREGHVFLSTDTRAVFTIFAQPLDLGECQYIMYCDYVVNKDTIEKRLKQPDEGLPLSLELSINVEKSYILFPRWSIEADGSPD